MPKANTPPKQARWRNLTDAQAVVLAALVAILPPVISGVVNSITTVNIVRGDELAKARTRIESALPTQPGYEKLVYPNIGIGVSKPTSWGSDDAAWRFGGGEIDLVKRYEDTKAGVGIKFRVRSVQKNYINDISTEVSNQLDVWRKDDANTTVTDTTISGRPAKMFHCTRPTGKRVGDIKVVWLRLLPQVKLEIQGFVYTDSNDREEFWKEFDSISSSIVLDAATITAKADKM